VRVSQATAPDSLINEIIDALHSLGGQAHRDVVVNCIAAVRRSVDAEPPHDLAHRLIAAFDDYLADPPTPSLLALPFGAGSRRWALTHEGLASLRQSQGPF
jgi:hypothetical protein